MSRKLMLLCNERQSLLFTNGTKFVRNCRTPRMLWNFTGMKLRSKIWISIIARHQQTSSHAGRM